MRIALQRALGLWGHLCCRYGFDSVSFGMGPPVDWTFRLDLGCRKESCCLIMDSVTVEGARSLIAVTESDFRASEDFATGHFEPAKRVDLLDLEIFGHSWPAVTGVEN